MSRAGVGKTMEDGIIREIMRAELGGNLQRDEGKTKWGNRQWVLSLCEQAGTCPSWIALYVGSPREQAHGNWMTCCTSPSAPHHTDCTCAEAAVPPLCNRYRLLVHLIENA